MGNDGADLTCKDCIYWRNVPVSIYDPASWDDRPYCHAPERWSWYAKVYTVADHPACPYFKRKGEETV